MNEIMELDTPQNLPYSYLFSWEKILEGDIEKFIKFLKDYHNIDSVTSPVIDKIDDKTIKVTYKTEKEKTKFINLSLNKEKNMMDLIIDEVRANIFKVKKENGKLNIYTFAVLVMGANGWGRNIIEAFEKLGHKVKVLRKKDSETPDYPYNYQKPVEDNDIIFIAVPDNEIDKILKATSNSLTKDKILLECATNKNGFDETIIKIASEGASVCSTHPMVKPNISPRGHNVIFMPLGNKSNSAEQVADLVYVRKLGMKSGPLDFKKHTEYMIIVQMVPHLLQRILIDTIGRSLADQKLSIDKASRIASANYMLSEIGFGRVGSQEESVSAGIIESGLKEPFGLKLVNGMISSIEQIIKDGNDRERLQKSFKTGIDVIDPDGTWKSQMEERTDIMLTRLGNLRSLTCKIKANDKPGILRDILNKLYDFEINMTALDSAVDYETKVAIFEIGIEVFKYSWEELAAAMKKIDCTLLWPGIYLFNWGKIPGNDTEILLDFLKKNYGVDWIQKAKIEKIDGGKTMNVTDENNIISLSLEIKNNKVNLKIDDGRTDFLIAKIIDGNLNIYQYY